MGRPGIRRLSTMRRASRFNEPGRPAGASKTTTPTGRGLDQGFEVSPRALLAAVRAGVGDRGRGLGGKQHQHLFVVVGELLAVGLLGEEQVADLRAPVAHRSALESPREHPRGRDAERADVAGEVGKPQRARQPAQVLEQAAAVRPCEELLLFFRREAGEDGLPGGCARLVDGGDDPVAGAGEHAGAVDHLGEHGIEVERAADTQDSRAQNYSEFARGAVHAGLGRVPAGGERRPGAGRGGCGPTKPSHLGSARQGRMPRIVTAQGASGMAFA